MSKEYELPPEHYQSILLGIIVSRCPQLDHRMVAAALEKHRHINALVDGDWILSMLPTLRKLWTDQGARSSAARDLKRWIQMGYQPLAIGEGGFPDRLAELYGPPLTLWVQGEVAALSSVRRTVGIVGSRRADAASCAFARHLAQDLAASGVCVVSGLAYGIDAAAHRGALESKQSGSTVAVLGGGFENLYPRAHQGLAQQIVASSGAVVSQFCPDEPPLKWNFINRNRIIAALSEVVVVVRAAEKSGALATASFGLEQNRTVCAVPGSPWDEECRGTNKLLRDGATVITDADDVFELLGMKRKKSESDGSSRQLILERISPDGRELYAWIKSQSPLLMDAIHSGRAETANIPVLLLELEMNGCITREGEQVIAVV